VTGADLVAALRESVADDDGAEELSSTRRDIDAQMEDPLER
jgi:hypothetical protein